MKLTKNKITTADSVYEAAIEVIEKGLSVCFQTAGETHYTLTLPSLEVHIFKAKRKPIAGLVEGHWYMWLCPQKISGSQYIPMPENGDLALTVIKGYWQKIRVEEAAKTHA